MADLAITGMTEITTPVGTDLLEVIDISEALAANQNKKMTLTGLFASAPAKTGVGEAIVCVDNAVLCIDNEVVTL